MSKFEVNFFVDFNVDSPQKEEIETSEEPHKGDSIPPHYEGPGLRIVPPTDQGTPEVVNEERQIIDSILNNDIPLHWIESPKAPEKGQN